MKDTLISIPSKPGVYIFKDAQGTILYVGKAINLKSRVASYFSGKQLDRPWISVMIGLIKDIETIIVTNEIEALMLEATLIKERLPKFNIKLTDDKSYPFIALSKNEPIPRFSIIRSRQKHKGKIYFGPYLSARSARFALELLRDLYGIHISQKPLSVSKPRRCFYCELTGHPCPIAQEISLEDYQLQVDKAVEFLRGKKKQVLKDLKQKMSEASEAKNFELAAKLRDRLQAGEAVQVEQDVISGSSENYDAFGIALSGETGSLSILEVRNGQVRYQRHFFLENEARSEPEQVLSEFLTSFYPTLGEISEQIVLPVELSDKETIENYFGDLTGKKIEIKVPQRGEKIGVTNLAFSNAQIKLEQQLIEKDKSIESLIQLQQALSMKNLPMRIEAIDISNLGTSEPVGACICFINGRPEKNEYRRYIIKTVEGQNDFAMIREVVGRRLLDSARPLPDLLLIDGGKEQLKFAVSAASAEIPTKIISLAKKPDRIFVPGRSNPLPISKNSKGLLLLARIRDEVHRYGLSFQRSRQLKKSLKG